MKKVTLENKVDGLVVTVEKLAEVMRGGFGSIEKKMEEKFDGVGQEFVKVYDRFNQVDNRISGLETTMNHRFDEVGGRLTSVESRVSALEGK